MSGCLILSVQQGLNSGTWIRVWYPVLLFPASACSTVLPTKPLWCFASAHLLCLGVWEPSGSQWPWQFCLSDQTHPRCDFHSAEPKQTGGPRRLMESRLQLACSVTVYTITPFKICQLHCWDCQNPSDCCWVVSTFPNNISLHSYKTTSPQYPVSVVQEVQPSGPFGQGIYFLLYI